MKKNYKRYNDGGNGHPQWHGHCPDDFEIEVLWIMSIIRDSPVMTIISHSMLTLTTPLFLFEEPPKIKGALIVIIFKISIEFGAVLKLKLDGVISI